MVPAAFVFLDALPLTSNGKVDRRALPAPTYLRPELEQGFVAARNEVEEQLTGIWAEVLGLESVGIHDDFFELGGHSLLATQVISRVRETFDLEVPLSALFEGPTVAQLAEHVQILQQGQQRDKRPELLPVPHDQDIPLSFAQQRLWIIDRLGGAGGSAYNMVAAVRLDGDLHIASFEASLERIIQRHEIMRTRFVTRQEKVIQVVQEKVVLPLVLRDLSHLSEREQEQEIRGLAEREVQRPFDLSNDVLLRLFLLRCSAQQHVLVLTTHHIVVDGWSVGIFLRELMELYGALIHNREPQLPELVIRYRDYSVWQRAYLQEEQIEQHLHY
jgi:acyl carrier protein